MNANYKIKIDISSSAPIIFKVQCPNNANLETSAQGSEMQTRISEKIQKLEVQEAILEWLLTRRAAQEAKLNDANLRLAQEVLIRHNLIQIDEEIMALLQSSGIDNKIANQAVHEPVEPSYSGNGRLFS